MTWAANGLRTVALLLAGAALVQTTSARAANATAGYAFRSPNGNIACRYLRSGTAYNTYDSVNCYTEHDSFLANVQADGKPGSRTYATFDGQAAPSTSWRSMLGPLGVKVPARAPRLGYGHSWWNGGNRTSLRCVSAQAGITCRAYVGAAQHGFFISRDLSRVW